jgi:hypothetical protein
MPVTGADIDHWYRSSSGDSEGGAKSATEIIDATDENVFDDVGDIARIAGGTMYRKIFLVNEHAVDAYDDHSIWALAQPTNATGSIGLGFDDADDADETQGTLVDLSAAAVVALVSDGADTRTATIYGIDNSSGDPVAEDVVLTGSSEVLSVTTFSSVYAVRLSAISASRAVSIKQGAGGTVRGTLPIGAVNCFRWLTPATSKSTGLKLPPLASGEANGIWERVAWAAGAGAIDASDFALKTEAL